VRRRRLLSVALAALGLAVVVACSAADPPAAETEPVELTVFAAASLTDAFAAIGRDFSAATPGVTVAFNFAGSNQLAAQIEAGAPADVFAGAALGPMAPVQAAGRVGPDAARVFATNRLVIAARPEAGFVSPADLAQPGRLLVLAAPEVPAGQYALEFLDRAAADPAFGPAYREAVLANVVSYEQNVRGALTKVALGEADAAVVYASDVRDQDVTVVDIPDSLNVVAEYPAAALNDSPHAAAAVAFVDYLLSPAGQATLADFGFGGPVR
jgi:molybdate transport system substrate-binding protein